MIYTKPSSISTLSFHGPRPAEVQAPVPAPIFTPAVSLSVIDHPEERLAEYRRSASAPVYGLTRRRSHNGCERCEEGNVYIIRQQTSTPEGTWDLVSFRRTDEER
jgi:hypothetical protein